MGGVEVGGCACARAGAVALARGAPARRPRVWRPPVRRESAGAPARARAAVTRGAARETEEASKKRKKRTAKKRKKSARARRRSIGAPPPSIHRRWYAECMGFDALDLDAPIPSKWCISMVSETGCRVAVPLRGGGRGGEAEGEGGCHSARARAAGGPAGGRWAGGSPSSRAVTRREEGVGGA